MPTNEPIQGFTVPALADAANVPAVIEQMYAQLIPIGIPRFATVAARDAAFPSPANGQACWVAAENAVYVRSGGQWRTLWTASWARSTTIPTLTDVPSGWTVFVASCVREGSTCQLSLVVTPTAAAGSGNVGNVALGTLPPGFRPAGPATGVGTEWLGSYYLNTAGALSLTAIGAAAWAAAQASNVSLTYLLA